jgi:hypothetical protein
MHAPATAAALRAAPQPAQRAGTRAASAAASRLCRPRGKVRRCTPAICPLELLATSNGDVTAADGTAPRRFNPQAAHLMPGGVLRRAGERGAAVVVANVRLRETRFPLLRRRKRFSWADLV